MYGVGFQFHESLSETPDRKDLESRDPRWHKSIPFLV